MAYVPSTGNGSALAAQNRANVMTSTGLIPWLVANSIPTSRGMMSEIGIPGSSNPVIDPNYDPGFTLALQQLFLDFNSQNMHVTLWSGGEWRIDLSTFLNVDGSNKALNYRSTTSSVLLKNLKGANGVTAGRGINLWGAEASDTGPSGGLNGGTLYGQYYFPQTQDFAALASVGVTELRFPYRMERLQPTLLGAFNTAYLAGIQQALTDANTYGIKLYLDPHNYGRYDTLAATNTSGSTSGVYMLGQNAPSSVGGTMQAAFVDHMVKLVNATKGYAGLWGWGLNNEPHDLPNGASDWQSYCRAAVEAIRANDQTHYIFVGGYNYQGFGQWSTNNGSTQWLTETIPAGQAHAGSVRGIADDLLIWDGHMYFDYDGTYSGSGSSFTSLNQSAINSGYAPYNNGQTPVALDITSQTGERQVFSADEAGAGAWTVVNPGSNTLAFTTLGTTNILKVTTTATSDEGAARQTLDNTKLSRAVTVNFGLPVGANLSTTNDYTIAHFWDQHYYAGTGIVDLAELRVIGTTGGYLVRITQPSGSYLNVTGTTVIPYSNTALHSIKLVMTDTGYSTYIDGSSTADATFTNSNTGNSFGGLAFGKFYGTSYIGDMYYGAVTATQPGAVYDAPPNGGLFYTPTTTTTTTIAGTTTTTTTTTAAPTTTTTTTLATVIPDNTVFRDNGTAGNWAVPTGQTGVTFGGNNGFTGVLGQSPSVHIVYTGGNYDVQGAEATYATAATIWQFFHRIATTATIGNGAAIFTVYTDNTYGNTTAPIRLDILPITGSTTTYKYAFVDPSNGYLQTVGTTTFTAGQSVRLVINQTSAGWKLFINDSDTPELSYVKTQAVVGLKSVAVGSNAETASGGFSGIMDFGEFWFGNQITTPTTDTGRAIDIYLGYKQNHLALSGYLYKNSADGGNLSGTPSIDGVSEDVGYFEKLAVQMNDQAAFKLADNWVINNMLRSKSTTANTQNNAAPTTALNLMAFHFNSANTDGKGIATIYDANFATDADNDRMLALFWAHGRWGSSALTVGSTGELVTPNYLQRALNVAGDLRQYAFSNSPATGYNYQWNDAFQSGTKIQTGGDYANPVAFKLAAQYDTANTTFWNNAVLGTYDAWTKAANVIFTGQTSTAKLNPDWFEITVSTAAVSTTASTYGDSDYGYNAFRLYPRLLDAFNFYNDTAANTVLALPASIFATQYNTVGYIPATMKHDGTATATYEKSYFTWDAVYSLKAAGNTTLANTITSAKLTNRYLQKPYGSIYNQTGDATVSYDYYGQSWGLEDFMRSIGLWTNYGSSYVPPTTTTTTTAAGATTTTTTTAPPTTTTTTTVPPATTTTTTTVGGYKAFSGFQGVTASAAQVNSDWNSTTGVSQILNKPTIPTNNNQLTNGAGYITASGTATTISGSITESQVTNLVTDLGAKQAAITLTTTGSGAATLVGATLNIPTPGAANFQSLTTTGTSGAATLSGGVLNIPTPAVGLTNPMTTTGDMIMGGASGAAVRLPAGSNGQILRFNGGAVSWDYPSNAISQATTTATGIIQLAGDLAGSATSVTVAKIVGITLSTTAPTAGQVLTATSATAAGWSTPATGGGSGTVTTVSVVTANGFAGTVATNSTTPAITLTTSITGVLKGNGTAISAATAGTDYQAPITLTTTGSGAATFASGTLNIPTPAPATFTSLTTTGTSGAATLTSGVLNIPNYASGGFTNPMTTAGDLIYGGASGTPTRLATGTGLLHAGATPTYSLVSLTADVTGTLGTANGGTGATVATGSGNNVLATSPTLVTPTLGVATATTINKVTITAPTTNATLTLVQGSTLATAGAFSITLTSTAATNVTLPTSGTLATTAATLTGDVTGNLGASVVAKINGVSLAGLATGILKNTTTTGVPSIAVAADFPTLNQSTTGSAAQVGGITITGTPSVGYVPTATSGTAATWQAPASGAVAGTTEDTAGYTYPTTRQNLRGTISLASGTLSLYGFTAGASRTITKLGCSVGATAAAGVTHFQMGIYTVNTATGALTLVASTNDQTTGLTAVYTPYQVALATSYALVAGTRYMVGITVSATTMPIINAAAGSDDYANNNYVSGVQQRLVGTVAAQATLPSTLTDSAISANGNSAHVLLIM